MIKLTFKNMSISSLFCRLTLYPLLFFSKQIPFFQYLSIFISHSIFKLISVLPEAINQLSERDKTRYNKLMQTEKTEKRYFLRTMIVGKETVGKTCLMRRLLKEDISDVISTDGVDIVVRKCKINIEDGKWIIGKGI